MDPARWQRIEKIYHDATQKPSGERTKFLDQCCEGDDALREEVLSLLDAQEAVGEFMATPPLEDRMKLDTATSIIEREELAMIGKTVGAYRIEGVIASGGMGTVYLAERTDQAFRHKVAIKLIRGGLQSRDILRRFYRERQILANLNHPNIARLLDGGTSSDGNPYLVMEYIKGTTIDDYCDDRKLTVSERLALFQKVCSAVQYAHGKLVVHRDIKPRNILVTSEGEPKLLDFGIVKLLDPEDELAGTLTLTVQRLMTPEYASPEQMRGETISTASDIYSLGIVLYELLTGHRPFRFQTTSAKEVERIVCEVEPPKPSTVINQSTEIVLAGGGTKTLTPEIVSQTREGKPDRLRRRLKGDLDQVVMKALRKEPEQRYASVEHFFEDIRRHLRGLPVFARRGTWKYRAQKFVKRHKAVAVVALMILVVLAGWGYMAVQDARQAANLAAAEQVLGFLSELLDKPFQNKTPRDEIRQTLKAEATLQLFDDLKDQPEELIRYADTITHVCDSFHLYDLAVHWRGISIQCQETLGEAGGADLAQTHYHQGRTLLKLGRYEEAESQVRAASELMKRVPIARGISTGMLKHLFAEIYWNRADYDKARKLFEDALQLQQDEKDIYPVQSIDLLLDYADFEMEYGDSEKGMNLLEQALDLCREVPDDQQILTNAEVYRHFGNLLRYTPRFMESELYLRKAHEIFQSQPETDPRLIACTADMAAMIQSSFKYDADFSSTVAAVYWKRSRDMQEKVFGADSLEVANNLLMVSEYVLDGAAVSMLRKVEKVYLKYWPENHPRIADVKGRIGASMSGLRSPVIGSFRIEDGEKYLRNALATLTDSLSPRCWIIGKFKFLLAINLTKQKRFDEADHLIEEGLQIFEHAFGERHPYYRTAFMNLGLICENLDRPDLAEKYNKLMSDKSWIWPYHTAVHDCDFTREHMARIDFEDDQMEKILKIDDRVDEFTGAILWIFGQPQNYAWQNFRDVEDLCIRVNLDPRQEISFNLELKFSGITNYFQWIPFEIPVDWLVQGANYFTFYVAHDQKYESNRSWEYNNLYIGVDMDNNFSRSWCFGGTDNMGCCTEMGKAAYNAEKPLLRESPIITEHRAQGYGECDYELMILLELF
ncbi:MAG: protein kinase domain-containing protein [Planctomycetota bacterium]|jgi:serine/threonine protein kinase